MVEKNEGPGNNQNSIAGEIMSDSRETPEGSAVPVDAMVEDAIVKVSAGASSDTLVGIRSVMSADPVENMDDARVRALMSKMNINERKAVKGRIEEVIVRRYIKRLREVVDILCDCMPLGVKKPKLCDVRSNRGVRLIDPDVLDLETSITLHIKGVICKISVEEDGVKMYVKISDTEFVLYCE